MIQLRPYQTKLANALWLALGTGATAALGVLPTGAGKTVTMAHMINEAQLPTAVIAHRSELVSQLSLALAREGVRHGLVASEATMRDIVKLHMDELGRSYVDPGNRVRVASVDTLILRDPAKDPWFGQVRLWVQDEAHHVLRDNKWGKAAAMFPLAKGLGFTATPCRADGKGLGAHAEGLFNVMEVGATMRDLLQWGNLCDYKIYCPPSDLDFSDVSVGASGDYVSTKLAKAFHRSTKIVGDVVGEYLLRARGKRGITFAVDIEAAQKLCEGYRAAGVPAELITGKTPDLLRAAIMRRFRAGEILQLCNVDILGEGVDVPAVEVVSFVRKTESFALYSQQFGRALRPAPGKPHAIIIDHVGNVVRHKVPDAPRVWTLDRRDRRGSGAPLDATPMTTCPQCTAPYERIYPSCPHCGFYKEPALRGAPEHVDGDLHELPADVIARMRGEVEAIKATPTYPYGAGPAVVGRLNNLYFENQRAQADLQQAIAWWAGWRLAHYGEDTRVAQRRFFHTFGLDTLSAQALKARDAQALLERVKNSMPEGLA